MEDPDRVIDSIKEFYERTVNFTLSYNPITMFIWTMRSITRQYMKNAYPELRDMEVFERMKALLGLKEKFIPFPDDEISKEAYTVWGFKDYEYRIEDMKTIGDAALTLNRIIWDNFERQDFRDTLLMLFNQVPDLKKEFFENVKKSLKNRNLKLYENYLGRNPYSNRPMIVIELLGKMSPLLFLGAIEIVFGSTVRGGNHIDIYANIKFE
ncbi:MAG: hypothetical protein ACE5KE_07590 [Methanosarcinales archaeon]